MSTSSYYQVLGLEDRQHDVLPSADVKFAYRQALLRHHPDKSSSHVRDSTTGSAVTVDEITLAYKTIADPVLRAKYDRILFPSLSQRDHAPDVRTHHTGLETVDLDSLDFDDQTQVWSRSCRCGDTKGFLLTERELETHVDEGEIVVGCKGCSLWLKVLFSVAD
nr:diphthamide biosynthesis protein 4 [Quercus suber]